MSLGGVVSPPCRRDKVCVCHALLLPDATAPLIRKARETVNTYGRPEPGSRFHLALVEVVRRQYKLAAQAADRANKEAIRATPFGG
jgi:hypothetical protein